MNGPNSDTVEDDGYLLGLVYDASKHRTFLAVWCSATCVMCLLALLNSCTKALECLNAPHLLGGNLLMISYVLHRRLQLCTVISRYCNCLKSPHLLGG